MWEIVWDAIEGGLAAYGAYKEAKAALEYVRDQLAPHRAAGELQAYAGPEPLDFDCGEDIDSMQDLDDGAPYIWNRL